MSIKIKETAELLRAANKITLFLISRLKDGAGFDDAIALYSKLTSDEEFKSMIFEAYDGIKDIPAELRDLDYTEVTALLLEQVKFIPIILDEIKKP